MKTYIAVLLGTIMFLAPGAVSHVAAQDVHHAEKICTKHSVKPAKRSGMFCDVWRGCWIEPNGRFLGIWPQRHYVIKVKTRKLTSDEKTTVAENRNRK